MAVRKLYKITRELKKDETYAPQGMVIIEVIKANGEPIERGELLSKLQTKLTDSKQTPARVLSFFRQQFLKSNLLKESKENVVDPNKPAKAASSTKKAGSKPKAAAKTAKGKKVA